MPPAGQETEWPILAPLGPSLGRVEMCQYEGKTSTLGFTLRCCSPEFDQIARKAGRDYSTDLRLHPPSVAKLGGEYGPLQTEGDKRGNNPAAGLFEWNVPAMEDLIGGWPKLSKEQEDAVAEAMAGSGRISRRCFFGGGGATAAGKRDRKYRAIRRSVRSRLAVGSGPHGENNR